MSFVIVATLFPISAAKASIVYPEYHPQDLINDESLYSEVDALTVEGDETQLISQINFSKFTKLKEINLFETTVLNGAILDLTEPINKLYIVNSVVNISSFDLDDFDNIWVGISYNVGGRVDNAKIAYWNFLNQEYYNEYPYYGLEYEGEINEIAMGIYESSDKTPQDIIRLVTLYVVENMEYDDPIGETSLEIILRGKKGVCVNYAVFESILLNKLGIFALDVTGSYNSDASGNTVGHAWNIVYTDGAWYSVDPTWLDTEDSILALKNIGLGSHADPDDESVNLMSDPLRYYMQDNDNPYFNAQHLLQFTKYDSIPVPERVSKMSIIPSANESNNEYVSEEIIKNNDDNAIVKAPDTGLFISENNHTAISDILIISLSFLSCIFMISRLINRIIKKYLHQYKD